MVWYRSGRPLLILLAGLFDYLKSRRLVNVEHWMWDAGDNDNGDYDYMNGEEDDEEGKPVCSDSVDGPRALVSCVRSQMDKTLKARECPSRKRR